MRERMRVLFPLLTIKIDNGLTRYGGVYTVNVNVYAIRVRAWGVKRLYAAVLAKGMLCDTTTEGIG